VVELDAGSLTSGSDMYDDVAVALDFPAYFGRNLDALNDSMRVPAAGD
jgi:RNAse (barnase) inhibitor barstar